MGNIQPAPVFVGVKPFVAWNRLESRPRKRSFENVLKAELHDPLWMLARQWQMGEYKGDDTGSGILARVQMNYTQINGVAGKDQPPQAYDMTLPLEPLVEHIAYEWSEKERIMMSRKWFRLMEKNNLQVATYQVLFENSAAYIFDTEEPGSTTSPDDIIKKGAWQSKRQLMRFLSAAKSAGYAVDGGSVYKAIKAGTLAADIQSKYLVKYGSSMSVLDQSRFAAAMSIFTAWVEKMYTIPATVQNNWNDMSLAYQFDTFWPDSDNPSQQRRLTADKYHEGHFDWHAFTEDDTPYAVLAPGTVREHYLQLIMAENRFAGMPASRWWEFENGAVNFAQLDGNTTDMAKIILTQFALVYQDDWFVVPLKVPVGSYSEVKGIVVTDVFGIKTYIANHTVDNYVRDTNPAVGGFKDEPENWRQWSWMKIGKQMNAANNTPSGKMAALPTTGSVLESKPLETVLFIRDEVSNMVWGIEKTVPDGLGRGEDGYQAAESFVAYLNKMRPPVANTPANPADPAVKLSYELNKSVIPENWIPFVAAHKAGSDREIMLQRAAMPRLLDAYPGSVARPRTSILRPGITATSVLPYFINEEEVPRAGTIVETSFQRTRWFNGRIVNWVGRSRTTGRGEGASGLVFDSVKNINS